MAILYKCGEKVHKDFILGLKDSSPICMAFVFMCISFGGLADAAGVSLTQTMSMAMLIYAIPLQVIMLSIAKNDLTLAIVVTLTFVLNVRFFLMSLSLMHYFKNIHIKKLFPAFLILSASSFTVSHVKFLSNELEKPFNYYLGIALPAYMVTAIATYAGFHLSFVNNNPMIGHIFSLALAIHFTSLTAIRYPNLRLIAATLCGFFILPLLSSLFTVNVSILLSPFLVALIMLFFDKQDSLS